MTHAMETFATNIPASEVSMHARRPTRSTILEHTMMPNIMVMTYAMRVSGDDGRPRQRNLSVVVNSER